MIKQDPDGFYLELPSSEGPIYGTPQGLKKLDKIKKECIARGDLAYYVREYEGRYQPGGAGAVFPMFDKAKHTASESHIYNEIKKDFSKLEWISFFDPGSTTVFGNLTVAMNRFTQKMYILGEIYEKNPMETTTRRIWPNAERLALKWNPNGNFSSNDWRKGYDEAAAWFSNEVMDHFGIGIEPTNKKLVDKQNGLSLIKDQMLEGKVIIADTCTNLIWEIERYVKDKNGAIPKKHDHLIDIWRYINSAIGFKFEAELKDPDKFEKMGWRGVRPADDFDLEEMFGDNDFE